jgi:VIT1/CCC1 family predicted Fe2+/Mn2+ transporter
MKTSLPSRPRLARALALLDGRDPDSTSRHRDVSSGGFRAAVLGAGDGLLTNVSLVLGVAGASAAAGTVRLAGVAGLLAGSFSMAAGELLSVQVQKEMALHELEVERRELSEDPDSELRELAGMYRARGVPTEDAMTVARILSSNEKVALDTHARLELGIHPEETGSAAKPAAFSFVAFAVGAFIPLFPWLFALGSTAVVLSMLFAALAALALGALTGRMSGRPPSRMALRQLGVAVIAAGVTFGIGHLLGAHSG